jgi:hypothetical protein
MLVQRPLGRENLATSMLIWRKPFRVCLDRRQQSRCGQRMQWYVILVSVATTGAFGWFALELIGRPIRSFFDLRRPVRRQMLYLATVPTPQPRETCVTSEQIRQYDTDLKNVREAQRILRDLASQMLAFAESERAACIAIRPFGFDPSAAGHGLIGLANALNRHGPDRASFRKNVERALRFS